MSNVQAKNQKLRERAARILAIETGLDEIEAGNALIAAEGDLRVASVMLGASTDIDEAKRALAISKQVVSAAIELLKPTK